MKTIPLMHEGETYIHINEIYTEVYICTSNSMLQEVLDQYCARNYSYFKNIKHGEINTTCVVNNSERYEKMLIKDYTITTEELYFQQLWEMLGKHV